MTNDLEKFIIFDKDKRVSGEPCTDAGMFWIKNDRGSWDGPHSDWLQHREMILGRVKNFGVCVQAGGNLGLYPKLLSQRFSTVYTFEPDIINFYCLSKNVTSDNVIKINAALGNSNELVSVDVLSTDNLGMNKISKSGSSPTIPMFKIDQLNLQSCDLIWLDIEQSEKEAIFGAEETIKKFRPLVAIETAVEETKVFLGNLGYDYVGRTTDSIFEYKRKLNN
jgi:FkbM family methyltransferase